MFGGRRTERTRQSLPNESRRYVVGSCATWGAANARQRGTKCLTFSRSSSRHGIPSAEKVSWLVRFSRTARQRAKATARVSQLERRIEARDSCLREHCTPMVRCHVITLGSSESLAVAVSFRRLRSYSERSSTLLLFIFFLIYITDIYACVLRRQFTFCALATHGASFLYSRCRRCFYNWICSKVTIHFCSTILFFFFLLFP